MPNATTANGPQNTGADRVGEELADDAHIWHVYDRVATEDDARRIQTWDRGLDSLAVFAGLISAVTTAFIIEAQKNMKPDFAELAYLVLNATATDQEYKERPFVPPSSARTVNCLWISSLISSLCAALIAIMGKDWIGMYSDRPECNLRQWAEMRTYRVRRVNQWRMSGVIAAAPVLLHISILLFGAGLVSFIAPDPFTRRLTLVLCALVGALYLVTSLSAIVFSASPFKSPATQMLRVPFMAAFTFMRDLPFHHLTAGLGDILLQARGIPPPVPGPYLQRMRQGLRSAMIYCCFGVLSFLVLIALMIPSVFGWFIAILKRLPSGLLSLLQKLCGLQFADIVLSTTWTDILPPVPQSRRPALMADSLSWLIGGSQTDIPDAVLAALGDLDIGIEVGMQVSPELRDRVRKNISLKFQTAELLALSRYVLADYNLAGGTIVTGDKEDHFQRILWTPGEQQPCEHGLAAAISTGARDGSLTQYIPAAPPFTHPHLLELLCTRAAKSTGDSLQYLLTFIQAVPQSHGVDGRHMVSGLTDPQKAEFATKVKDEYGGRSGLLEGLTFICRHGNASNAAIKLALTLVSVHVERSKDEHPCLAYLYGDTALRLTRTVWEDWNADKADKLLRVLPLSPYLDFRPGINFNVTSPSEKPSSVFLARTVVRLMSPLRVGYLRNQDMAWEECHWATPVRCLYGLLCHPSIMLEGEVKNGIIDLILEELALCNILQPPDVANLTVPMICAVDILADIAGYVGQLLAQGRGKPQLRKLLAFRSGNTPSWSLGTWIRTEQTLLRQRIAGHESAAWRSQPFENCLRQLSTALTNTHQLCLGNNDVHNEWSGVDISGLLDTFLDETRDVDARFSIGTDSDELSGDSIAADDVGEGGEESESA